MARRSSSGNGCGRTALQTCLCHDNHALIEERLKLMDGMSLSPSASHSVLEHTARNKQAVVRKVLMLTPYNYLETW